MRMRHMCGRCLVALLHHPPHCQPPLPLFLSAHQSVLRNALPSTTGALCPVPPTCCFHARYTMHTYRVHAVRVWMAPCSPIPALITLPTTPPTLPLRPPICVAKRSTLRYPRPVPCAARPWPLRTVSYSHVSYACGALVGGAWFASTSARHTANHPSHYAT
jgi:hypothetical protein